MAHARGALIAFEGIDRSGKSTLVQALSDRLNNEDRFACTIAFPQRHTSIGAVINQHLRGMIELPDEHLHALFSANRWEFKQCITSMLQEGSVVLLDRYVYSGLAYSVAKGLAPEWCRSFDAGLPEPDLVFYLDIPVAVAAARGDFGAECHDTTEFQQRVDDAYKRTVFPTDGSGGHGATIVRLTADRSADELLETVVDEVLGFLAHRAANAPIGVLWKHE